jgi:hypothetical protein
MGRGKYSSEQILAIFKEQEAGTPVADLCRTYGMHTETFYAWKRRTTGMPDPALSRCPWQKPPGLPQVCASQGRARRPSGELASQGRGRAGVAAGLDAQTKIDPILLPEQQDLSSQTPA